MKVAHLVMVTENNNNKFYHMEEKGDLIHISYGRIGSSSMDTFQPLKKWDSIYKQKIKKGYVDKTELYRIKEAKDEYLPIENKNINEIVTRLRNYVSKTLESNFDIDINFVTDKMIEEALELVYSLGEFNNVESFNKELLKLFSVIPRKMKKVNYFLSTKPDDFIDIIKREEELLDVVIGKYDEIKNESSRYDKKDITILEEVGLEFEEITDEDVEIIKKQLGSQAYLYFNAWKIKNKKQSKRFESFISEHKIENIKLLWHGTRSQNIWSILCSSLKLKPNAIITGKMFGNGIYFAPKARKSIGYTSLEGSYWAGGDSSSGFMILNEVAYGKPYDIYEYNYKLSRLNYKKFRNISDNCDCLHAHGKKHSNFIINDEIIIYREEQCNPKYLVELKKRK